jgi:hypothetical protein
MGRTISGVDRGGLRMAEIEDDVNGIWKMLQEIYYPECAEAYMVIIRDEILEKEMNGEYPAQVLADWKTRLDYIIHGAKENQSLVRCPCCRYFTLEGTGYEVCDVCYWEDDGQDDPHADEVWGGPNADLSLTQGRENFERIGACQKDLKGSVVRNPEKYYRRAEK